MAIVDNFPAIKANMERRPSKDDMIKEWFRSLSLEEKEAVMARHDNLQIQKYLVAWGDTPRVWKKLLDNGMFANFPGFLYSKLPEKKGPAE